MLIYNVTTQVAHSIHQAWVQWMQQKHIPEIMEKGCFEKFQFVRVLETDETEGVMYAVQFFASTQEHYDAYITQFAPQLRADAQQTWGQNTIGFRSLMQVIS